MTFSHAVLIQGLLLQQADEARHHRHVEDGGRADRHRENFSRQIKHHLKKKKEVVNSGMLTGFLGNWRLTVPNEICNNLTLKTWTPQAEQKLVNEID